MKSFLEYILEDIELIPVKPSRPDEYRSLKSSGRNFEKVLKAKKKRLGDIHPDYELYQYTINRGSNIGRTHYFNIVHKPSQSVVGNMTARGGRLHPILGFQKSSKGKGLKVVGLDMHTDHRSKKVGVSLPVEMYRHLHRLGYGIQSDAVQSHGAAHVWNTMRQDPELKKHIMIHDQREPLRGEMTTFIKRAYKYPEKSIWHQFSRSWGRTNPKVEPTYGVDPEIVRTLILSGKKRKKR